MVAVSGSSVGVVVSTAGCTVSTGVPSTVAAATESVTASKVIGAPPASKKATGTTPSVSPSAGGAVTVIWSGLSTVTLPSASPKRTGHHEQQSGQPGDRDAGPYLG